MTVIATWRRAASLAAAGLFAILLAGCVVTSTANLVSPGEAAAVLPETFVLVTYNGEGDTWAPSAEAPGTFTLTDGGYVAPDDSMAAYFVPLDANRYLLAATADDATMYGVATLRDGILEIRMLLAGDPAAVASGIAGATVAESGITVTDRAGLDAVIALMADGTLATEPLIAWVGAAAAPASIVKDGDWYKAGD